MHRDIILLTKTCQECQETGKSIKTVLKQKHFGKVPIPDKIDDELAIKFAGPFKLARSLKRYLIVSVDRKSGWPDTKFLRAPTAKTIIEFLKRCIGDTGIRKQIRTDPGTAFTSTNVKNFCEKCFIKQIKCPITDHRGNGKVK